MATVHSATVSERVRPIMAAVRTATLPVSEPHAPQAPSPLPFITISRQAGAGAWTLAQHLVDKLNALNPAADPHWTGWDRELVEKVAADHRIAAELIESLEDSTHSWLADLFTGMSYDDRPELVDEARVYHKVAATIRALAKVGHVVIVGRGGVCITRGMPGGIHIRLIAPMDHRVANMARQLNYTNTAAKAWVQQMDHNRAQFYRRYWPGIPLMDDAFALTLNAGLLSEDQMISSIRPLIGAKSSP